MTVPEIRQKVDQLDAQLVGLLNQRMQLVAHIGQIKRERGQSVFAPEREELLLRELDRQNAGPLNRIGLRSIYREILSASRANQSPLRIIYLGAEDSRDFLAARMRFGSSDCYRSEPDVKAAIGALQRNEADVAVVSRPYLLAQLAGRSGDRPFQKGIRLCGEINLLRELGTGETSDKPCPARDRWKGPEQFFIICQSLEETTIGAKSVYLLQTSQLKKSEDFAQKILEGSEIEACSVARLKLSSPSSAKHYLCEIIGAPQLELWRQRVHQLWGRQSKLLLLGSYPSPQIYG